MLIVVHRKVAAEQVTAIAPKAPTVVHLDNAVPTYWSRKARHTQGRRPDSLQERNRKKGQHAGEKEEILLRFSYHAYLIGGRDKNGYATRKRQKWMEYPKHTHFFFFSDGTKQNETKRNETASRQGTRKRSRLLVRLLYSQGVNAAGIIDSECDYTTV